MLLNFFDVDTATGDRSVELQVGDYPQLALQTDLLVVSTFSEQYAPSNSSLLHALHEAYDIRLTDLEIAVDLRNSPIKAWVSTPIVCKEDAPASRFTRIAVVEGAIEWQEGDLVPWPPFNRLFSLLALLPMRGIASSSVATPLLGNGNQGINALAYFPELLEAYREAFQHVPELQRLILFDRTEEHLRVLGAAINAALERPDPQELRIDLPTLLPGLDRLEALLRDRIGQRKEHSSALANDLGVVDFGTSRAFQQVSRALHLSPNMFRNQLTQLCNRFVLFGDSLVGQTCITFQGCQLRLQVFDFRSKFR